MDFFKMDAAVRRSFVPENIRPYASSDIVIRPGEPGDVDLILAPAICEFNWRASWRAVVGSPARLKANRLSLSWHFLGSPEKTNRRAAKNAEICSVICPSALSAVILISAKQKCKHRNFVNSRDSAKRGCWFRCPGKSWAGKTARSARGSGHWAGQSP